MKEYVVVVFDVDGTLLDTGEGVISSIRYTIEKHGLKMLKDEELRTFVGPPIQKSFAKYYDLDPNKISEIALTFRNHYKDIDLLKAQPYEGIFEVLDELKKQKIQIAVATYKREDYALKLLKHFGFDRYTSILYGSDMEGKLTKRDIIEKAIHDSGLQEYNKAVMVGDSDNDAIGANELGTAFIGVTFGFDFKNQEDVDKFPNIGTANKPLDILDYIR